jgi:hypothetical protein
MRRVSATRKGGVLFAFVLGVTAFPAVGQDPVKTDPAFNHVEFENERVRILRIRLGPGQKDSLHEHPAGVAVTLTDQHVRVTGADGVSRELRRKAGEARYLEPSVHRIENLSEAPYETILVELKGSPRDSKK